MRYYIELQQAAGKLKQKMFRALHCRINDGAVTAISH